MFGTSAKPPALKDFRFSFSVCIIGTFLEKLTVIYSLSISQLPVSQTHLRLWSHQRLGKLPNKAFGKALLWCHIVSVSEYWSTWTDSKQGCFDLYCHHEDSCLNLLIFSLVQSLTFSSTFRQVLESLCPCHLPEVNCTSGK